MLEVLAEGFTAVLRLLAYVLKEAIVQLLFETLIRGTGYLLCRPFSTSVSPDGFATTVVGLFAWIILFLAALHFF